MTINLSATEVFFKNQECDSKIIVNRGGAGSSKGQPLDTEIITPKGRQLFGELKIGDEIFTADGSKTKVIGVHNRGIRDCYKFIFSDGASTIVDDGHLWDIQTPRNREKNREYKKYSSGRVGKLSTFGKWQTISTLDIIKYREKNKNFGNRITIPTASSLQFDKKDVLIDAYTMGCLLGDGSFRNSCVKFTTTDFEIIDYIPYKCKDITYNRGNAKEYRLNLKNEIQYYNLWNKYSYEKHIPEEYLFNSEHIRIELLRGLMDTDGMIDSRKNSISYCTTSEKLAKDVLFLVRSLGGRASIKKYKSSYKKEDIVIECKDAYIITIKILINPFKLNRKAKEYKLLNLGSKNCRFDRIIRNIEYIGKKECMCITVAHDSGLYITEDVIVTHNSVSIVQLLIYKLLTEKKKKILILRKTLPSLRASTHQAFLEQLDEMGVRKHIREEKQHLMYYYDDLGNTVRFASLDNPEKIKSSNYSYIFMEEATEFSYPDFMQLKLRLREPSIDGNKNKIYMAFNPIDEFHWIKEKVLGLEEDVKEIVSTYRDNPFLQADYIKVLEDLVTQDANYYRVYALGEWGKLENLIYRNWRKEDNLEFNWHNCFYGLDFGYNDPCALVQLEQIDDKEIKVKELLYHTGLTNTDLIKYLKEIIPASARHRPIYCDAAEPDRIKEIRQAGFNAKQAQKKIQDGIDNVKRYKLVYDSGSRNLIIESQCYSWKTDKDGNVMDEPVDFKNHLKDAERYAIHTHLNRARVGIRWIKM